DYYASCQIKIAPYEDIYQDAALIEGVVMLDTKKVNYALASSINCDYVDCPNPSQLEKAIKNEVEIKNAKNAHLKDGIAVTKFMYWLKTTGLDTPQTEISLAEKLASFRRQQPLYVMDSFTTICAYRENGAIIHYHAVPEHNAVIKKEHMVMIDSGGQYFDGTTDITRTFVLGEISEAERHDFTLVLKGFLHLLNARFPEGTSGSTLDMLARAPLWQEQKNYLHGTGHGVGHFLNVHEGPQNIRYNQKNEVAFVPGMITSDEPGYYLEGQYGIRHENLILCIPDETEGFYRFESLTLVPIDLDGIDVDLLNEDERKWLNFYHSHVYNKLKPYLTSEEAEWLKQYTRAIGR
ncbi:MAG: aminopeptidase family protein P, partial [bacterium]